MSNKTYPNKKLGKRVKALRKEAKYTQSDLAEKLHFSSEKTIAAMENGRRSITPQTAELMANLFCIDVNYLLDESVEYKTPIDKFDAVLSETSYENTLMLNAICSLAALNGYDIELQQIKAKPLDDLF